MKSKKETGDEEDELIDYLSSNQDKNKALGIKKELKNFEQTTKTKAEKIKDKLQKVIQIDQEKIKGLNQEIKSEHKKEESLAKEISVLEKEKSKLNQIEKAASESKDEDSIDFSGLKDKAKNFFKGIGRRGKEKEVKVNTEKREEEEVSLDFSKVVPFFKNNAKWLVPVLLILITIFVSTYFRTMTVNLPITDNWAEGTVHNFYKNQLTKQINEQYPNLPEQNRQALVDKEFGNMLIEKKEQLEMDISQLSKQYKAMFQDENGETYLLEIDPYLWYSEARNVLKYGHLGDKIIDGKSYFSLRDGRLDKKTSIQSHPYIIAYWFKFLNFFDSNINLMRAQFFLPVILMALSLIPAFFIGRKLGGNVGGFFTAIFIAINAPLLGRTPAGFSDTDPYNILYPLIVFWLFLEAYTHKKMLWKIVLTAGAGFFIGVYNTTWNWQYLFYFVIATIIINTILNSGYYYLKKKEGKVKLVEFIDLKKNILIFCTFILSSAIFVTLFRSFSAFLGSFARLIKFTAMKEVGVKTIWPNVLTTVAEFNPISFSTIINQMGGQLLFVLSIIGILLLLFKKNEENNRLEWVYFSMAVVWFAATAYSFTKGARFAILMATPFAFGLGSVLGIGYEKFSSWLNKGLNLNLLISRGLVFVVLALVLISPLSIANNVAKGELPLINDEWYNAIIKIKEDSVKTDAIITSWWDFGHWFYGIGERRVTFDGGDQGERIHWVGKILLTDNEDEAIGILRMLNCVQETAPAKLDEFTNDSLKSVQMLYQVFQISDRKKALQKYIELGLTKEQATVMLEYTHCQDLIPNYFITSEDMVGKAGVWGHFGSWDFKKASMYQQTQSKSSNLSKDELIKSLADKFNLTASQAAQTYSEIKSTKGDQWIAPWPGYLTGLSGCTKLSDQELGCVTSVQGQNIAFRVSLEAKTVAIENVPDVFPNSFVYATKEGIVEKKLEGKHTGFSFVLVPKGEGYQFMLTDPLIANSIFTKMFFFEGQGLKCFSKFDDRKQFNSQRILTWKADFNCNQKNQVYFLPKEEVKAAHILISTQTRSEEEALKLITEIKEKATTANFEELAKNYSEDPGSKASGGNLGWFGKGMMVPAFEQAAFALEAGKISEPVKSQFGYHIIWVKEKKTE